MTRDLVQPRGYSLDDDSTMLFSLRNDHGEMGNDSPVHEINGEDGGDAAGIESQIPVFGR